MRLVPAKFDWQLKDPPPPTVWSVWVVEWLPNIWVCPKEPWNLHGCFLPTPRAAWTSPDEDFDVALQVSGNEAFRNLWPSSRRSTRWIVPPKFPLKHSRYCQAPWDYVTLSGALRCLPVMAMERETSWLLVAIRGITLLGSQPPDKLARSGVQRWWNVEEEPTPIMDANGWMLASTEWQSMWQWFENLDSEEPIDVSGLMCWPGSPTRIVVG